MEDNFFDTEERKSIKIALIISTVMIVIFIVFAICATSFFVTTYNNVVTLEENVKTANAGIETRIQRRAELIPDLMAIVEMASVQKMDILEKLVEAQDNLIVLLQEGNSNAIDAANKELSVMMNEVLSTIQNEYPEIVVGDEYTGFMDELAGTINRITVAREYYNEQVNSYNIAIKTFPGNMIAVICGFEEKESFTADEAAKETINYLKK